MATRKPKAVTSATQVNAALPLAADVKKYISEITGKNSTGMEVVSLKQDSATVRLLHMHKDDFTEMWARIKTYGEEFDTPQDNDAGVWHQVKFALPTDEGDPASEDDADPEYYNILVLHYYRSDVCDTVTVQISLVNCTLEIELY